jgi:ribosome-binding protein aMBF1 (putative translation factor)
MNDAEEQAFALVVGEVVEWHRTQNNLSQRALAEESGVAQSTISRIERGDALPDTMTLKRLARGLGLTVQQLTDDIEYAWEQAGKGAQVVQGGAATSSWWLPVLGLVGAGAVIGGLVALALGSRPKRG